MTYLRNLFHFFLDCVVVAGFDCLCMVVFGCFRFFADYDQISSFTTKTVLCVPIFGSLSSVASRIQFIFFIQCFLLSSFADSSTSEPMIPSHNIEMLLRASPLFASQFSSSTSSPQSAFASSPSLPRRVGELTFQTLKSHSSSMIGVLQVLSQTLFNKIRFLSAFATRLGLYLNLSDSQSS